MKTLIAVAAAIAGLAAAPTASADPFSPEAETFYVEALDYWGQAPLCSPVVKESVPLESLAGAAAGEMLLDTCQILVEEGNMPCLTKAAIYHEVGHLVGLEHSADPDDLMYPELRAQNVFCEQFADEWETQHRRHMKRRYARGDDITQRPRARTGSHLGSARSR
jgi:hypothetical protein